MKTPLQTLMEDEHFHLAGKLAIHNGAIDKRLAPEFEKRTDCIYAFVVEGDVKYIGKTQVKLRTRMRGYRNKARRCCLSPTECDLHPSECRDSHVGIKREISRNGNAVDIYVSPCPRENLFAQEDRLIKQFQPPWNRSGK